MLEQIHPRVTRDTGQVEGVNSTIFPLTTLQPGTAVWAYMVGAGANLLYDDFWPEGENVEDFIAAATEGRYEAEEDEPDS